MKKFGGFDHNLQTIRTVIFLENRYYNFKGLNLTYETLDGLLKHNGPFKNFKKFNQIIGKNYFKNKINFSSSPSLEAQIAAISDDIAYNSHDLEDGLKSDLFKLEDLINIPTLNNIVIKHLKQIKNYSIDIVIRQIIREIINEMVKDLILTTKNIKKHRLKNLKDVDLTKYKIVDFSKRMQNFDKAIKKFKK